MNLDTKWRINIWQLVFLVLSTSWLSAPFLNHYLSYRTALISQYELPGQPYSTIFRLCDALAALILLVVSLHYTRDRKKRAAAMVMSLIAAGMLADPIFSTTCHLKNGVCIEYISVPFFLHALETIITSFGIFVLSSYDAVIRKRIISIGFVIFQVLYTLLFVSQLASHDKFNTFSQFLYQIAVIIWIAWFTRDYIVGISSSLRLDRLIFIKRIAAGWAFLNGLSSILISLADIRIIGKLKGLYFAGDSAWLAQHGMVIGVVLLYLSRHLLRGERRARHIFMAVSLLETLKYAVITPQPGLMFLYFGTFIALFILKDAFDRGPESLTWRLRIKEVIFLIFSLAVSALVALFILYNNTHSHKIATGSVDHFFDYTLTDRFKPDSHLESTLLAHAFSAFLISGIIVILWILFKPVKPKMIASEHTAQDVYALLQKHSNSTEDYFKYWPQDKQYFWHNGSFITYKMSGAVAYTLADPIGPNEKDKFIILQKFISFCRNNRLRICILPIYERSKEIYEKAGLNVMQIGASALVDIDSYLKVTSTDKWWRWQKNRATKNGYNYAFSHYPHSDKLLNELQVVSNSWLSKDGRTERSFAMGYFDRDYINQCDIHYLKDSTGEVIAFTNQLPTFKRYSTATLDLIRHMAGVDNAMPFLLFSTINHLKGEGYQSFDLGFVPFAETNDPAIKIIRSISSGRFSAKGLEQFKNKFDPKWQPNYLAYDGDFADLALITLNVERVMSDPRS